MNSCDLLFADDILIFCNHEIYQRWIVVYLKLVPNLKANLQKSEIIPMEEVVGVDKWLLYSDARLGVFLPHILLCLEGQFIPMLCWTWYWRDSKKEWTPERSNICLRKREGQWIKSLKECLIESSNLLHVLFFPIPRRVRIRFNEIKKIWGEGCKGGKIFCGVATQKEGKCI